MDSNWRPSCNGVSRQVLFFAGLPGCGLVTAGSRNSPGADRIRNQTSIHKAAHGLIEPPRRPAPPPTRHVRLRSHPGPRYGHAVDRHPTTAATPAIPRTRPPTSCSASSKSPIGHPRSPSEAYVFPHLQSFRFSCLNNFFSFFPSTLAKAPAVRRACTSCHSGKTRCSEILPCQVYANICAPHVFENSHFTMFRVA